MHHSDSIEVIEENLDANRTNSLCLEITSLSHKLWCFSLRKCVINNIEFEKLIRCLKKCKSLRYINFNLNVINSFERVTQLATLLPNLSYLDTLCLHSSNLNDGGLRVLYYSLISNEHFRSLDIGDCDLSDESVPIIKEIMLRNEHSKGLAELIISYNPKITQIGWSQILIAVAAAPDLKYFHMDYNNLDDNCGYLIAAILTANHNLEVLDLEHTGLTDKTGLLLFHLVKNYRLSVKTLNLIHNKIDAQLMNEIQAYVENEIDSSFARKKKQQEFELQMRDQLKLDKSLKNANSFNKQKNYGNENTVKSYEKQLEKTDNQNDEIEEEEDELILPTKDHRYDSHIVMPFKIK